MSLLVVFGGLPATGKTTLARELARRLAANALAADNLMLDRAVVADCVNPVLSSRNGWRETALRCSARLVEIEIICSDLAEHRRRVESRVADIEGLIQPSWDEIRSRSFEPWDRDRFVLDTAGASIDSLVDELQAHVVG